MKHDNMLMEGQGKHLSTSRKVKKMVKFCMISANMNEVIKGTFMSLQLVHFLIDLLMLMHD